MRSPILKEPCSEAGLSFSTSEMKIPVALPPITFIPSRVFGDGFLNVTDLASSAGQSAWVLVSSLKGKVWIGVL